MNQIKYSIIIPHHNIPELLERCLRSIPQREDIQIIVVDDKSDEKFIPSLRVIEKKYDFVDFVYLEQSGGGGKARNAGLEKAVGDFLIFADADDYFNYCFNEALDDYKDVAADIVFFASNSVDTDTYQNSVRSEELNNFINNFDGSYEYNLRYHYGVPWGRIVKRSFVEKNNIRFQETVRHNDVGFSYLIGYYAKEIKVDRRAIYCVTTRKGSTSTNVTMEALRAGIFVYVTRYQFLTSKGVKMDYPDTFARAMYRCRSDKFQFQELLDYTKTFGIDEPTIKKRYRYFRIKEFLREIKHKIVKRK